MSPPRKAAKQVKIIQAGSNTSGSDTRIPNTGKKHSEMESDPGTVRTVHTPPNSPVPGGREPTITMTVAQFVQAVKAALHDASPTASGAIGVEPQRPPDPDKSKSRASKLSYVSIKEM